MRLQLALEDATEAFGSVATCGSGRARVESGLDPFIERVNSAPAGDLPGANFDAELEARALSGIFVNEKKVLPPTP